MDKSMTSESKPEARAVSRIITDAYYDPMHASRAYSIVNADAYDALARTVEELTKELAEADRLRREALELSRVNVDFGCRMRDERDQAQAELAFERDHKAQLQVRLQTFQNELNAAQAELREARAALGKYGEHKHNCLVGHYNPSTGGPHDCECGLDAAIKGKPNKDGTIST